MAYAYGQLVIGPPGSGKTTYCCAVQQFLRANGRRVAVVNLDPANDSLPYDCDIDISELITMEDVIEKMKLGPNGGLIYCMEFLEKNIEWLQMKINECKQKYFLFDCPGQVELFTHHNSVKNITCKLQQWDFKLTSVHLVDAHLCSDPGTFISALLTSLSAMLQIELPHINVLSKVDLIQQFGKLSFDLDFYTEVLDLNYLVEHLPDDPFFRKYKSLNQSLVGLIQDYSLVSFIPLNVQSKENMFNVMKAVDKASGYVFQAGEGNTLSSMMSTAMGAEFDFFKYDYGRCSKDFSAHPSSRDQAGSCLLESLSCGTVLYRDAKLGGS